jgi:hypothetical protein
VCITYDARTVVRADDDGANRAGRKPDRPLVITRPPRLVGRRRPDTISKTQKTLRKHHDNILYVYVCLLTDVQKVILTVIDV